MSDPRAPIGPALRVLREKCRQRQNAVAKRVGLHPSSLRAYDRGRRIPSRPTIARLLLVLDVRWSDLARAIREVECQRLAAEDAAGGGGDGG